jgi:hypothetical protein
VPVASLWGSNGVLRQSVCVDQAISVGLAGTIAYAKKAAESTTEKAADAKRAAVSLVNIVWTFRMERVDQATSEGLAGMMA